MNGYLVSLFTTRGLPVPTRLGDLGSRIHVWLDGGHVTAVAAERDAFRLERATLVDERDTLRVEHYHLPAETDTLFAASANHGTQLIVADGNREYYCRLNMLLTEEIDVMLTRYAQIIVENRTLGDLKMVFTTGPRDLNDDRGA